MNLASQEWKWKYNNTTTQTLKRNGSVVCSAETPALHFHANTTIARSHSYVGEKHCSTYLYVYTHTHTHARTLQSCKQHSNYF